MLFRSYKRFSFFCRVIFSYIDVIFAQSEVDRERLVLLGAKDVQVAGNIKTAQEVKVSKEFEKPKKRLIVYASTHKGEEALLLSNHNFKKDEMVVVVPRHPERFGEVDNFLQSVAKEKNLDYRKFSNGGFCECEMLLVDTMGELINIYAISDIVILGGSFVPLVGGHNPIEPATFNNVIEIGRAHV